MTDHQPTTTHAGGETGQPAGGSISGMSAIGSLGVDAEGRSIFAADELAIVLSHYRIGVIDMVKQFKRGSRKAPKLVLRSDRGLYLLKRRAHGRDDPFKVAFTHGVQLRLAERGFPLPKLIGTRRDNNSMVQYQGSVYELFEFVRGSGYDRSEEATADAGKTLSMFHRLLSDYQPHYQPPKGTYHGASVVVSSIEALPKALAKLHPGEDPDADTRARETSDTLHRCYQEAADHADGLGLGDWDKQIGHSDWHPGNMLFDGPRVVSVIDYDAARLQPRIIDVGNGALQFSIQGKGDDTAHWPTEVDLTRYRAFLHGYSQDEGGQLAPEQKRAIPWLMIQALIAESVIPIAATGSFAKMDGVQFLQMVLRKVHWIRDNETQLVEIANV